MTTLTIEINDKDIAGKHFLGLIKTLPFVSIKENKKAAKKEKVKDPTKMTKEEFYAKLERAEAQAARGEVTRVKAEDISKYLGLE
jgi:hypothetical protein